MRSTIRVCGITPAWAGKRKIFIAKPLVIKDYPRVGGEEGAKKVEQFFGAGLPPRGRGRVHDACLRGIRHRITPAWAGKRAARGAAGLPSRDYPRVGGEELGFVNVDGSGEGLPPRGRGREHHRVEAQHQGRITPAWAGKSFNRVINRLGN